MKVIDVLGDESQVTSPLAGIVTESLKYLATLDLDFSIEATGFAMAEIDLRIDRSAEIANQRRGRASWRVILAPLIVPWE